MRALLHRVTWIVAAVALVIATPVQAAAGNRSLSTSPASASAAASTTTSATNSVASIQSQETGRGWAELYCMACVGLGTLTLYSGGITMLPVILANPAAFTTMTGTCVLACESAIKTLLQ